MRSLSRYLILPLFVFVSTSPLFANPIPVGSCCFPDGHCLILDSDSCLAQGGAFLGTPECSPNPCPQPGPCCLVDGSCRFVTPEVCATLSGVIFPGGYPCSPNPCPCLLRSCIGACCGTDGSCTISMQTTCHGTFHIDAPCNPNPCETSGVPEGPARLQRSWGRIKSIYR